MSEPEESYVTIGSIRHVLIATYDEQHRTWDVVGRRIGEMGFRAMFSHRDKQHALDMVQDTLQKDVGADYA